MASYDGSIMIETKVDSDGLKKGMTSINKQANTMKTSFAGIGKAVAAAFAVKVLYDFGKQAVSLASDLQEVQNVVDVAFGDMSDKVEEFAKTSIETMGISELTAKKTASTYMSMGKGMGLAVQDAFNMSLSLTQLSADMASFYNISQERADIALKAVYTGETEVLKQYGIVMTEVNLEQYALSQGITKSLDSMNQQEKTMLRYNYVLQQTQLAQGDFARTSNSWANQTRILSENWKQFMGIVGNGLVQVLTPLVVVLNKVVTSLVSFANAIASVFSGQKLEMQETEKAIGGAVENQEDLTNATKKTNKEAKKTTASFDEIQKLQAQTLEANKNTGFAQTGGLSVTEFKIKGIEEVNGAGEKLQPFIDMLTKFKPLFLESAELHLGNIKTILEKSKPIFDDFINNFLGPIVKFAMDKFIEYWQHFNDEFEKLSELLKNSEIFQDLKEILEEIYKVLKPVIKSVISLAVELGKLHVTNKMITIKYLFKDLEDIIGLVAATLQGDFKDAWKHLNDLLIDNRIDEAKERFESLRQKIEEIAKNIKEKFTKENMDKAFENIGVAFGESIAKIIEWDAKIDKWIENKIKPLFTKEKWIEIFGNLKKAMTETMENVMGWFTKDKWEKAGKNLYNGLADKINSAIDGLQGLVNTVIDFFNKIIDGYNSVADVTPAMRSINNISGVDFSKYKIPKLAQGAVIPPNKEFMAILGDQKRGVNIETPLATMIEAFKQAQSQQTGELVADITLDIDGEKLYNQQQRIQLRRGTRLVTGGAF